MIPVKFKEQNITFTKPESMTDEECGSLPAYRGDGRIISCWKFTLREWIKALFTGRVWFSVIGTGQPPIWLGPDKPFKRVKKGA